MEVAELDVGDFLIGEKAIVMCKSVQEFLYCNQDRSLNFEVAQIQESYDFAALILDGDPFDGRSFFEPINLISTMSWLQAEVGVHVIVSKQAERTAMIIGSLAKHYQHGAGMVPPLRCMKRRPHTAPLPGPLSRYILEGLPGIQPASAILLANHFGSVHAIANADLAELKSVKGVGFVVAEKVYRAMRTGAHAVSNQTESAEVEVEALVG